MISTGPAQVQQYALVLSAKREAWLLLAAQHNAAAVSTISARHQHSSSTISATDERKRWVAQHIASKNSILLLKTAYCYTTVAFMLVK
uniref:Uncharacterized protein n=1 Tax=Caenorhabditis japonica TaxID=281687 RepID=A0A8R1ENX1_CAEJA